MFDERSQCPVLARLLTSDQHRSSVPLWPSSDTHEARQIVHCARIANVRGADHNMRNAIEPAIQSASGCRLAGDRILVAHHGSRPIVVVRRHVQAARVGAFDEHGQVHLAAAYALRGVITPACLEARSVG